MVLDEGSRAATTFAVESFGPDELGEGTGATAATLADEAQVPDNDLMAALARGDDDALVALIRRYERPLTCWLARLVNDADRARDLAQETFIRVYRHARAYRTSARFATWLFHIARNVARDELRTRRRRVNVSGDDEAAEVRGATESRLHARLEMRETILRALADLSPRDRALVLLRDLDGLSYDEVAERVGLPIGTVKSGLSRARRRFRECFLEIEAHAA